MNTTESLIHHLLSRIHTKEALFSVSATLEELAQNQAFKSHAHDVIVDTSLSVAQKKTQLLYLIKTVDQPVLYEFFSDILSANTLWLFSQSKLDYFDRFVQEYQMATENIGTLHLTTALQLSPSFIKTIAQDLSRSFGYQVVLDSEVNPAIIGGAQVRIENHIYDYSLRTKFQQFQRQWLKSIDSTDKKVGRHQP